MTAVIVKCGVNANQIERYLPELRDCRKFNCSHRKIQNIQNTSWNSFGALLVKII
jgi:hypothetical protein